MPTTVGTKVTSRFAPRNRLTRRPSRLPTSIPFVHLVPPFIPPKWWRRGALDSFLPIYANAMVDGEAFFIVPYARWRSHRARLLDAPCR